MDRQAATNHALMKTYSIVGLHLTLHLDRNTRQARWI
jgi:hypothetical protein